MFLQYDPIENCLINIDVKSSEKFSQFSYETRSGEIIRFECKSGNLFIKIPFFLCETIFYKFEANKFLITNNINNFKNIEIDNYSSSIFSDIGFLPLSRSRYKNIEVLCSFCTYEIGRKINSIVKNFPISPDLELNQHISIECVYKLFNKRILSDLKRFDNNEILVLLSGGIDSRLILDALVKITDKTINVQNHGMPDTGDVLQAQKIIELDNIRDQINFNFMDLNKFKKTDLVSNYLLSNGFLPSNRLLYFSSDKLSKSSVLFSGLYGDIIFADNKDKSSNFSNYCKDYDSKYINKTDKLLIEAYDKLPKLNKLNQVLFRCQKLTRFSFDIDKTSKISIPFLDNNVIYAASVVSCKNLYPQMIRKFMERNLSNIFHQSSCSNFTHPKYIRILSKIYHKLCRTKLSLPYFHKHPLIKDDSIDVFLDHELSKKLVNL